MFWKLIKRAVALLLIIWALGFAWFALWLPQPMDGEGSRRDADAVVVLTGAAKRIDRGLEALDRGWAPRMLVTGVDKEVKPGEFAAEYNVTKARMSCCVELGYRAVDTRSNALETARWVALKDARTIRLVTTDWHMRRAAFELQRVLPSGTIIRRDAVPSNPSFNILFEEYHKLLARWLAVRIGL